MHKRIWKHKLDLTKSSRHLKNFGYFSSCGFCDIRTFLNKIKLMSSHLWVRIFGKDVEESRLPALSVAHHHNFTAERSLNLHRKVHCRFPCPLVIELQTNSHRRSSSGRLNAVVKEGVLPILSKHEV